MDLCNAISPAIMNRSTSGSGRSVPSSTPTIVLMTVAPKTMDGQEVDPDHVAYRHLVADTLAEIAACRVLPGR